MSNEREELKKLISDAMESGDIKPLRRKKVKEVKIKKKTYRRKHWRNRMRIFYTKEGDNL